METQNSSINLKNIPIDQYSCPDCSLVPEFLKLDYSRGSLLFECPNHGEKELELKEYFSKELTYKCDKCGKSFNQLKENKNLNAIFNYCIKDKKYLCQNCSKTHEHKGSFIKVSESKIKCSSHLNNFYNRYCRECKKHYCEKDQIDCNHDLEEITKPTDTDIKNLINKRDDIKKKIEIEECLVKLLDTLLETYNKFPTNYFHTINIINISTEKINRNKNKKKANNANNEKNKNKNINQSNIINGNNTNGNTNNDNTDNGNINSDNANDDKTSNVKNIKGSTNNGNIYNESNNIQDINDNNINEEYKIEGEMEKPNSKRKLKSKLKKRKNRNEISNQNSNSDNEEFNNKSKNDEILSKLDMLEKKVLNIIKVRLGVELKGDELAINLNGKNIKNEEFHLLCKINFKSLEELYLSNNHISNVEPLEKLKAPNLKKIDLSNNEIVDVKSFKPLVINNKKVQYINLKNNRINDASTFKDPVFNDKEIILDNNNLLKKEIDEIRKLIKKKEFENIGIFEYRIDKKKTRIQIFGKNFVVKNKSFCKIIINGKQRELTEFYKYTKNIKNDTVTVKIIMNQDVTSLDCMFYDCIALLSLSEVSNWDTSEITDMSSMFSGCESLTSLPDISNWNTSNVKNMSMMFSKCKKLENLPDISGWNVSAVCNMSFMFSKCENLTSLPDLSKWNTSNVADMSSMFSRCENLQKLPNISKWNTSSVFNMSLMFNECCELKDLPDISGWNISKVTDKTNMFSGCSLIKKKIPKKFLI